MRGPKPKPDIICPRCNKPTKPKRGYCYSCYVVLLRKGVIKKLIKPILPTNLNKRQTDVLNGLMLGDGCLYRRKKTHLPYLVICRSSVDLEYLKYTESCFKDFMARPVETKGIFDSRTKKTYYQSRMVTRRAQVFKKFYNMWYPAGKKVVPRSINLSPLTLAIWFCDDGNIKPSCSPWRYVIKLSTHGFIPDDTLFLCDQLKQKLSEYFGVSRSKDCLVIYGADSASRAFIREIDNVFPLEMERKAYWRTKEAKFYKDCPIKGRSCTWLRKDYHDVTL